MRLLGGKVQADEVGDEIADMLEGASGEAALFDRRERVMISGVPQPGRAVDPDGDDPAHGGRPHRPGRSAGEDPPGAARLAPFASAGLARRGGRRAAGLHPQEGAVQGTAQGHGAGHREPGPPADQPARQRLGAQRPGADAPGLDPRGLRGQRVRRFRGPADPHRHPRSDRRRAAGRQRDGRPGHRGAGGRRLPGQRRAEPGRAARAPGLPGMADRRLPDPGRPGDEPARPPAADRRPGRACRLATGGHRGEGVGASPR